MLPADTFTFVSSSHASTSWLDHVLTTTSSHALVDSMHVKSNFISSGHLPLCFTISIDSEMYVPLSLSIALLMMYPRLIGKISQIMILLITIHVQNRIFPEFEFHLLPCVAMTCPAAIIKQILIISIMTLNTAHGCIRKCIPIKKRNEHVIVDWNDEVKHYHGIARSEFKF